MFFEGAEKRIEMVIDDHGIGFRDRETLFWQTVLAKAGASILSKTTNEYCDAYVLSESSLFVWQDKLILITCGNTCLIESILAIVETIGTTRIKGLCYQRKSELYPHLQQSHFEDDFQRLNAYFEGKAYRLGHLDGHHHYLFTYGSMKHSLQMTPCFTGIQQHHIQGDLAEYLCSEKQDKEHIIQQLGLTQLLPEFQFDDHLFTPYGYSVNAIWQDLYVTVHITPQRSNRYISIETNIPQSELVVNLFHRLFTIFMPQSWDVISFNQELFAKLTDNMPQESQHLSQSTLVLNQQETIFINHYRQLGCEHIPPVELI